jgi:hypothetical protein
VQQVSQPYYARRPEVPLPQTVLLNPQTHQATLREGTGAIAGTVRDAQGGVLPGVLVEATSPQLPERVRSATTDSNGQYRLGSLPVGTYAVTFSLQGFTRQQHSNVVLTSAFTAPVNARMSVGAITETVVVVGDSPAVDSFSARQSVQFQSGRGGGAGGGVVAAPPPPRFAGEDVQAARLAQPSAAAAQDLGDLFEYRLTQPVTIRTNQSAMVPILNAKVNAERVSLWNRSTGSGRPLRAVWLTNTSGLTLDGGSLSVIDGNAFAGEGLVEPLKPSEKRLVSYGSDLAVMVDARLDESSGRYTRVVARDGVVIAYEETRQGWDYRIRNEDATPRMLIIEHPVRAGWTLNATPTPAETTASAHRFRVPVAARAEATLSLAERRAGEARFSIDQMDDRLIASFGQRGVSVEELRRFLQPVIEARSRLADAERRSQELAAQVASVGSDQERMRETIKALGTSRQERALKDRYTRELGAQEDRLQALQKEIAAANAERDQRRSELSALMQKVAFEVVVK